MGAKARLSVNSPSWLDEKISLALAEKQAQPPATVVKFIKKRLKEVSVGQALDTICDSVIWTIHLVTELGKMTKPLKLDIDKSIKYAFTAIDCAKRMHKYKPITDLEKPLHVAIGRLHLAQGKTESAAWEFEWARNFEEPKSFLEKSHYYRSSAIRLQRLGHGPEALSAWTKAKKFAADGERDQISLSIAKCLRLIGQFGRAELELDAIDRNSIINTEILLEIEWEQSCIEMSRKKRCNEIIGSVLPEKSHYQGDYYAEAVLWAYAFGDEIWKKRLPKVRYAVTKSELSLNASTRSVPAIKALEACENQDIPIDFRIRDLKTQFEQRSTLATIDQEQLFVAACARWLGRNKFRGLAELALLQYQKTSYSLTHNKTPDHLGVMAKKK